MMDKLLREALIIKYEGEIAEARANIQVYLANPVGIGEHPQHIDEVDKLIAKIATAKENLMVIEEIRDI